MILYSINARIRHTDASDGIKHSCYKAFGFPNENIKLQIFFQQNIPIFAALSLRVSVCVCVYMVPCALCKYYRNAWYF